VPTAVRTRCSIEFMTPGGVRSRGRPVRLSKVESMEPGDGSDGELVVGLPGEMSGVRGSEPIPGLPRPQIPDPPIPPPPSPRSCAWAAVVASSAVGRMQATARRQKIAKVQDTADPRWIRIYHIPDAKDSICRAPISAISSHYLQELAADSIDNY